MRNRLRSLLAAPLGGVLLLAAPAAPQKAPIRPLAIGDPAPELIVKWVKGGPIAKFSPDRLYVVEFWATWCAPCRVAIPHLSELARKYKGRIDFIGVNVWEAGYLDKPYEAFLPQVKKFVDEMGERMDYHAAMDTTALHMTRQWMEAASQRGIPSSFLVKGGKVVWIGNPMALDKTLEQVLDGTYDMAPAAKAHEAAARREREVAPQMKQFSEASRAISSAITAGNYDKALRLIEEGGASMGPDFKKNFEYMKLQVYVHSDPNAFLALGKSLKAADANGGLIMADTVLKVKAPGLDPRVYAAAVEEYQDAIAKGTFAPQLPDAFLHNWMGIIYDRMGRTEDAIAAQDKALALAQKGLDAKDGHFTKDRVEDFRTTLEGYRKKAAAK